MAYVTVGLYDVGPAVELFPRSPVPVFPTGPGAVGPVCHEVTGRLIVAKTGDVTVRVTAMVESWPVGAPVELIQGGEDPIASTALVVVPALPVKKGIDAEWLRAVVRFHPSEDETTTLPEAVGNMTCEVAVPKTFELPPC